MSDFYSWDKQTLVQFAEESRIALLEREAEIDQLKADLKVAIAAYRQLMRDQAINPSS
jgi:hypothetical protein